MLRVWVRTMSFLCDVQKGMSMWRWFWLGAEWWGPSLSERRIWRKPSKTSFSTKWTCPDMAKSYLIRILTLKTTLTESCWLANRREMSKFYFKALCEFCYTSNTSSVFHHSQPSRKSHFYMLPLVESILLCWAHKQTDCVSGFQRKYPLWLYKISSHKSKFHYLLALMSLQAHKLICGKVFKNMKGLEEYPCHRHKCKIKAL